MDGNLAYVTSKSKSKYAASPDKPSYGGSDVDYSILSEAVLYRLRRAQLAVVQDFNDSLASIGLRPADFSVLIVVANNTDLKQSDVARRSAYKEQTSLQSLTIWKPRGCWPAENQTRIAGYIF